MAAVASGLPVAQHHQEEICIPRTWHHEGTKLQVTAQLPALDMSAGSKKARCMSLAA